MGKKSVRRAQAAPAVDSGDVPVVGLREPCPCGSGKRYKGCHGKEGARRAEARVIRPFAGLAAECDLVALRELVPAATAPLTVNFPEAKDRSITLTTVLPMAWPGLVRDSGEIFIAMQVNVGSGDPSRDLADAIIRALTEEPGNPVPPSGLPGDGPRLQDILDPTAQLAITVHDGFEFWIEGETTPEIQQSLERVSQNAFPTTRLTSVDAAYWTHIGEKEHLRWVMSVDEDELLTAFARLHAAGEDTIGEGTRFVGMFRSCGLLVPVWDLPVGFGAEACEDAASEYGKRLEKALNEKQPLSNDERKARAGLQSRQVTLR